MGNRKVKEPTPEGATKEAAVKQTAPARVAPGKKLKVDRGRIYINASYNNTVLTVTDLSGNVLAWASAGSLGFSGPKKATPFVASKIVSVISEKLKSSGPKDVEIYVKGIGSGRDSAIRSIINQGFAVSLIKDITPIPHNGPRPRKVRRV